MSKFNPYEIKKGINKKIDKNKIKYLLVSLSKDLDTKEIFI